MDIYAKPGHRVKYTRWDNGSQYDRDQAEQHLERGAVYTIESTFVHSWSTDVCLREVPGKMFNSVLFEDYA